jgi:ferredoxin
LDEKQAEMRIDREACIGCGKCFPGKEVREKAVKAPLIKKDLAGLTRNSG